MKNQLYDIVLYSCLIVNVLFLIIAFFDKSTGLFKIKDNIDPNQTYPFYILVKRLEKAVVNYIAQIGSKKYMHNLGDEVTYELGIENGSFNILYYTAILVFFVISISEKRFRMNRKYFLLYLFLTLVNPVTITIIGTNHLRNFSYILLTAAVIFLSIREFEISIISFISSYCINVDMLRVSFIEFLALFALVYFVSNQRVFSLLDRIKTYGYSLWLVGLFLGLNTLVVYELDHNDRQSFMRSMYLNILNNNKYSSVVLVCLFNLYYLIYRKKRFDEKLFVDFIVLNILVNGLLKNTNHLLVEHTFAIFLLNLFMITHRSNPVSFTICFAKIISTILIIEQDYTVKIATLVVQSFTVTFLFYRNKLLLTGDEVIPQEVKKLNLYETICKHCWTTLNHYGNIMAVVIVLVNVIGFFLKNDKFGDIALVVYFAFVSPMAKIFELSTKKVKKE